MRLGDVVPRLKIETGKWYTIEVTANADVEQRESDFGPVYSITVLQRGEPVKLLGGQNLMDTLIPLLNKDESMTKLKVMKEWIHDPESGDDKIEWSVEAS